MKKVLILLLLCLYNKVYAQSGFTNVGAKLGLGIKDERLLGISLNFPSSYRNSYELSADLFQWTKSNYRELQFAFIYKSEFFRERNTSFRCRVGLLAGTDFNDLLAGPDLGLEFGQAIYNGAEIIIANKTQYVFLADQFKGFRTSISVGLKIPL